MNLAIDVSNLTIKTQRLFLRPFDQGDLMDLYEYAQVDGVGQMAGWLPHKSIAESQAVLDMFVSGKSTLAICLDNKVVGSIGIDEYDEKELCEFADLYGREIGYVLAKSHWGKGYVPEAVKAVVAYLFEKCHLDFVVCSHFADNLQSKRVKEKCGFVHYKTVSSTTRYQVARESQVAILMNPYK